MEEGSKATVFSEMLDGINIEVEVPRSEWWINWSAFGQVDDGMKKEVKELQFESWKKHDWEWGKKDFERRVLRYSHLDGF